MATTGGANIAVDGLVFGYDTGYPLVSGNSDTYKFNRGEPTENLVGNPTFIGTSGTQTQGVTPANWIFSGETGPNGFKFYDSSSSPIPLKFPNEGSVITINSGSENRRIYFRRTDLLPNTTYTISCWMYFSGSFTDSWSKFQYDSTGSFVGGGYFDSFSNYASANGNSLEEWFLWEGTLTTEPTTAQCYWGPVIASFHKNLVGLQRMKVEVKDHRTPFVNGTRSVSGSLIDLTRTNDIDLSNVSFDSNAQMTFDGTDDRATYTTPHDDSVTELTYELVFKGSRGADYTYILHNNGQDITTGNSFCTFGWYASTDYIYGSFNGHYSSMYDTTTTIDSNKYYHLTLVWNGSTQKFYINGVEKKSMNLGSIVKTLATTTSVGGEKNAAHRMMTGTVPLVKTYTRALSAQEIQQNYNAVKERFSL